MAVYNYVPTHLDGVDLSASPFSSVSFDVRKGPGDADPSRPQDADVIGLGPSNVGTQPRAAEWDIPILLDAADESDLKTLHQTFTRDRGLVYLRMDDGDGTNWRVEVIVRGVTRVSALEWVAHLHVPRPRFKANTLTTSTGNFTNMATPTGGGIDETITNNGNRKALPTFTIDPDKRKGSQYKDWLNSYIGYAYNRSPLYLSKVPVNLYQTGDGYAGFNTDQRGESDTVYALVNEGAGVDDSQTTINFDGEVGGGLDSPGGMVVIDSEQILYTGNTGSAITGCVRGVGGTTPAAHSNNAQMHRSWVLKNQLDHVAWVNGRHQERWLDNENESDTVQWVTLDFKPAIKLTCVLVDGSSGENSAIGFAEDISGLPESGVIVCEGELISYRRRDVAKRQVQDIERGAWETSTAAAVGDTAWWVQHLYVTGIAFGGIESEALNGGHSYEDFYGPSERRPAIQLASSAMNNWKWGDTSDDPLTVIWDPANPDRPGSWRPDFTNPAEDNNPYPMYKKITLPHKSEWRRLAGAGGIPASRMTIDLPMLIQDDTNAVTYDGYQSGGTRLRVLGLNEQGDEELLATHYQYPGEGVFSGNTITPAAKLRALILQAVGVVTTGNSSLTSSRSLAFGGQAAYQKFVLDHETAIAGVLLWLHKSGGGEDFGIAVQIKDNSSPSDPSASVPIMQFDSEPDNAVDITGSQTQYFFEHSEGAVRLAAGTYWIKIATVGGSAGTLHYGVGLIATKHDALYEVSAFVAEKATFVLIHNEAGPVQMEGSVLTLDGATDPSLGFLEVDLNDETDNETIPAIRFLGGQQWYHCNGVISNDRNDKTITVDAWIPLGATLAIDCEQQTVLWTYGRHQMSIPDAITPSDMAEWFALEPGANVVTYSEYGMVNTDMTVEHRDERV